MANPIVSNPNASVAVGTGTLGVGVVWLLGNIFHIQVSAEAGATIATVAAGFALYVGRVGIGGVWSRLIHGNKPPTPPTTVAPPPPPAPPPPGA